MTKKTAKNDGLRLRGYPPHARVRNEAKAARQRLHSNASYRRRKVECKATYRVEIGGEVINMLIQTEFLAASEAGDAKAVARAIAAQLADSATKYF